MNREELLKNAKPILFNTEMVQAILEGRKTVTRRVIKPKYSNTHFMFRKSKYGTEFVEMQNQVEGEAFGKNSDGSTWHKILGYIIPKPPYKVGDILYVRETGMIQSMKNFDKKVKMLFKADNSLIEFDVSNEEYDRLSKYELLKKWLSPYWLTKETARIFLKIKDVRVERLQEITLDGIKHEGISLVYPIIKLIDSEHLKKFIELWDSTIKKQDLDKYGWEANPWVWVVEFKRVEVENE